MRIEVALAIFATQAYADITDCRRPSFDKPKVDAITGEPILDSDGVQVTEKAIVQVAEPQWNDDEQTDPKLDPLTNQQIINQVNAPCIEHDQGLQWENQSYAASTGLYELYNTNSYRIINDDNYTGDITISRRAQYPSLYFQRPVTDYDGCYNRVPTAAALNWDGYWDLQTIIDDNEQVVRNNIASMCEKDKCEYDEIEVYYDRADAERTTKPVPVPTPAWTTYLLSDAEYELDKSAIKKQDLAIGAQVEDSVKSSWQTELSAIRAANNSNEIVRCENSGINTFNSQINSFADKAAADAYFTALDTTTFTAAQTDFNAKFKTWNTAEAVKESEDFANQKLQAAVNGWFGNVMTTVYSSGFPKDVKDQARTDVTLATAAAATSASNFATSSTAASTASGLYNTAKSAYTAVCPIEKQKDLWTSNKFAFDTYMNEYAAYSPAQASAAAAFNFVDWTGSTDPTVTLMANKMATWANGADATVRAADATFIAALKAADPDTVALAIDHQNYNTQGTATPFSSVSGEINGIISTFNSAYATAERSRIDAANIVTREATAAANTLAQEQTNTANTSLQKTTRAGWIASAKIRLQSAYGSSDTTGWLAWQLALAPLQNPDFPAVAPTTAYVNAGKYNAMQLALGAYNTAVAATAAQLLLWEPYQEEYAIIARTNAANEILTATGQPATDLDNEMGLANDAAAWNRYAAKMKQDYDTKVNAEALAKAAYWTAIQSYVNEAHAAWNLYDQSFAATEFNNAKAFAVSFAAAEYAPYEALCTEKRAVRAEWVARLAAQDTVVAEHQTIYNNWNNYRDQFDSCVDSTFTTERQTEYDMMIAKALTNLQREQELRRFINSGLKKTTDVVNVVCPEYDSWYAEWQTWNSRQYVGPTQPTLGVAAVTVTTDAVYDCNATYNPPIANSIYNRKWCDGISAETLVRPCTLTQTDYNTKVAAVSDWHNVAALDSFNLCACDGQSSSCRRIAFSLVRPQASPGVGVEQIVPVSTITFDFNEMWNQAKLSNTDWLAWEQVTPINLKAKDINDCKRDVYATYKANIAAAEALIMQAEAEQMLTDPLEWVKQNNLYDTYWGQVSSKASFSSVTVNSAITTIAVSNTGASSTGGFNVRTLQSLDLLAPDITGTQPNAPVVTTTRDDAIVYNFATSAPGNAVVNWLEFAADLYRPPVDSYYGQSKERGVGPVAMTTCTNVAGDLSGMQVFFGQYMHKAGASHGDMAGTCTKTLLEAPIQCIEFYYGIDTQTTTIVGMNATMWPDRDGAENQVKITTGKVGTVGARMFKKCFPLDNAGYEFFGFESTVDINKKITTLNILAYNPVTMYEALWLLSDSEEALDTAQDQRSSNMASTRSLIINDLAGQLPVPTGQMNVAGVYRPEQYRQDLEVINIAIAQIDSQMAADAAKAAVTEAAAEEAAATALDNETATELTTALLDHSEEEREANTGALVAAVIGGIILIGLLGFCCMRMCANKRRSEMAGAGGQQIRVNNSSFRSEGNGNQGKLDDIM